MGRSAPAHPMSDETIGMIAGLDVAALAIIVWIGALRAYVNYRNGK